MKKRERFKQSVAVFVILKNEKNEVLLLKRSNTSWMDGYYSLPAGGLEEGEGMKIAAVRELYEEVGVHVSPIHLELSHVVHSNTNSEQWFGCFFTTLIWEGSPRVNEPDKHSEVKWVRLDQLPENIIPYVRQALESSDMYSEFGW